VAGAKLRDRSRSVKLRVIEIGRAARAKGGVGKGEDGPVLSPAAGRHWPGAGPGEALCKEIADGVKRPRDPLKQLALEGLREVLDRMLPRVRQVIRQTKARILDGDTHAEGKIVSLFEPSTEIIRKGKAGKPTEFGKMVKLQEAENQIVTDYEVYDRRPADSDLLIPAIDAHLAMFGRVPRLVAADAGFYSGQNQAVATDMASSASASPIARPRAPSASASRRSAGSATGRNGAPDAKAASAWSSDATASIAADTRAMTA